MSAFCVAETGFWWCYGFCAAGATVWMARTVWDSRREPYYRTMFALLTFFMAGLSVCGFIRANL